MTTIFTSSLHVLCVWVCQMTTSYVRAFTVLLGYTDLWHVVDQQQRYGDCGYIMCAADLQDVSQTHDGRVPGRDVPWTHVVVHTQVKDNMHLREVGVPWDVKLTFKKTHSRYRKKNVKNTNQQQCGLKMIAQWVIRWSNNLTMRQKQTWPLPGKMLDGFLSTFLLLSSPPFLGISVWTKN